MTEMSHFAETIIRQKYAQQKEDGTWETWSDIAHRVAKDVMGNTFPELQDEVEQLIRERKFLPGGRTLYAAGRPFKAFANCYLLRAEDSREGWAKLMHDATSALMSGGGIGVNYSTIRPRGAIVGGLGGICTGPIALMEAVNETARQIQAGGSRRAAVYASLHWWHPDVFEFIKLKNWDDRTKEAKAEDFNARAPMDMTNISVALDDAFFEIMDGVREEAKYTIGRETYAVDRAWAEKVYAAAVKGMLETGEPGFQVDLGDDSEDILRNAPLGGDTHVLTDEGYKTIESIVGEPQTVWTGKQWAHDVVFSVTNPFAETVRVTMTGGREIVAEPTHPFVLEDGTRVPAGELVEGMRLDVSKPQGEAEVGERDAYRKSYVKVVSVTPDEVQPVYCADVKVDEHSFMAEGVIVANCTEIVSSDHFDMCNLGSLNMGAFEDIKEWKRAVWVGTHFLLAVSVVGDTPNEEARKVRRQNRRLGLGLMGLYDWLVARGLPYGPSEDLREWLVEYEHLSDSAAESAAEALGVNIPIAVRSVAPAGTISIVAECSSGIEPLFATAYKRRYLKGDIWHYQYVVDAGARRLQEKFGIEPDKLETAYDLAYDPERRIAMQAFVQEYVDNAISSTLNLPSVEEHALDPNKFAAMLYNHLPSIRGITAYPDGARGGQPLTVVPYSEASSLEGVEYEEFSNEHGCIGGVCGI